MPSSCSDGGGFSFSDLFWAFFIVSMVWPLLQRRALEASRFRLIRRLEGRRGTRVITLIHRQETMSFLGFPIFRYIDINDSEEILRAIRLTDPQVPIDLILHTPGGLVLASELIARAITNHKGKVTVFVPHYAMSGGTLIALAADEIVMDENAVLGPVDPQLGEYPAASILRVLEQKPAAEIDDRTLILADISRKALAQVKEVVSDILKRGMGVEDPDRIEYIAEGLTQGRWTHDYPINVEQARHLGLPVSTDMPREIHLLMQLFPQAAPRRPSVDYIPVPYRTPEAPPRGRRGPGARPN
jgi:ClpP class serine protease